MSSGGTCYVVTPQFSSDFKSSISADDESEVCATKMAAEECAALNKQLLFKRPTQCSSLNQKENNDKLKLQSDDGCDACVFIEAPYKFINTIESSPNASWLRIGWNEISSIRQNKAEKKNEKDKKHTNKVTTSVKDRNIEKEFQKRRRRKLRLFNNTEERFEDKMPYICFECKKMFGFFSSLDEHENSHALTKLWKE